MKKIEIQDFFDLFAAIKKFNSAVILDISLPFWGAGNDQVNGSVINELVKTY